VKPFRQLHFIEFLMQCFCDPPVAYLRIFEGGKLVGSRCKARTPEADIFINNVCIFAPDCKVYWLV